MGPLPDTPDSLYLHDLALLPASRGVGAGTRAVRMVFDLAAQNRLGDVALMAVNGAETFWTLQGFAPVSDRALHRRLQRAYGDVTYMHRAVYGGFGSRQTVAS